jgi:type I protein arginine methyltransferase
MNRRITGRPGYELEQVWLPASEQLMEWDMNFHDLLLGDKLRMAAFHAAIDEVIFPGCVVLDLGAGTGILTEWALRAGAGTVYGIELNESLLKIAVARVATAGYSSQFHPVLGISFGVNLLEPVDVIVSETMGNLADNEGFVDILKDARRRFLVTGGVMMPSRVESYLVPVAAERAHAEVRRGDPRGGNGRDDFVRQLRRRKARSPFDFYYDAIIPLRSYLSEPRLARQYMFKDDEAATYELQLTYRAQRAGLLTGFKGYFMATLSDTVKLDISGDDIAGRTTSDSWKHCYLPVEVPCRVQPEDRIELIFSRSRPAAACDPFRQTYRWEGKVVSAGETVARFSQRTTSAP